MLRFGGGGGGGTSLGEWEHNNNDSILIICVLQCTRLFKEAHAAFDQGRGFERGRGGNLPSPLMAFFNIHVIDIFTTY